MGMITLKLDDDVEAMLRSKAKRKGDLGKLVSDALRTVYLMKAPEKKE